MRVVVDPNVLVAAAITNGVSARLLDHWLTVRSFELVVCPMLIAESRDDPVDIPQSTPDPKDDYLVALYREADADALVTGDADFAGLTGELVVVTPAEMLARL